MLRELPSMPCLMERLQQVPSHQALLNGILLTYDRQRRIVQMVIVEIGGEVCEVHQRATAGDRSLSSGQMMRSVFSK